MDKGDRQNGGPEQVANNRDPLPAPRPAPGKVTRTSQSSPGREPAVQRKAAAPGVAPVQARSRKDHTMDVWMDAAHRGATALPESSQEPVQAHGGMQAEDPESVHRAAAAGVSGSGSTLPYLDRIQTAFGGHDVSGVQAHTGGAAADHCSRPWCSPSSSRRSRSSSRCTTRRSRGTWCDPAPESSTG